MTKSRSLFLSFSVGMFVFSSVGISELESPTMAASVSSGIGASVTGNAAAGLSAGTLGAGAAATSHVAAHAAHGASTAAQAIAASQQAAMMFRMLMAKGVMDYFQRKEMDRANQVMAQKMEKLQKEVQSGKLTPAEFAAIKAAVEETYAKYSKIDPFKDKAVQPDAARSDKNSKSGSQDSLSASLGAKEEAAEKLGLQSGASDLARLESGPSALKNPTGKDSGTAQSSKGLSTGGSPNQAIGMMQTPGLAMMAGAQTPAQQSVSIQNTVHTEAGSKEKAPGAQVGRGLASIEFPGSGLDLDSELEMPEGPVAALSQDFQGGDESEHYSLLTQRTPASAHFGASLKSLLNPIKFQKNPFSTKLHTEEGIHLGLLLLFLAAAFLLGRKLNREKKIPRVIPEVILTPEKISYSKALAVKKQRKR
ncbi:MAG: hypothetical protein EBQ92_07880 [Proteobacteria bacterium]|nr:hypothetical protein [Pseudomonadota bacterium]